MPALKLTEGLTPVISMHQPWCFWVAKGWKTIETRTHRRFQSLVGRRIGIHASLKWDDSALNPLGPAWLLLTPDQVVQTGRFLRIGGAVICTAFVRDFMDLDVSHSRQALIDCGETKRFGLFLEDVQSIEAVPVKGRQGIWYMDLC